MKETKNQNEKETAVESGCKRKATIVILREQTNCHPPVHMSHRWDCLPEFQPTTSANTWRLGLS